MSRPIFVRPEARADILQIHDYLLSQRERLRLKFESRFQQLFDQIGTMPYLYGKVWRNVRAVRISGFRYVLYYIVFMKQIDVIAVLHGSRVSPAWMSRI